MPVTCDFFNKRFCFHFQSAHKSDIEHWDKSFSQDQLICTSFVFCWICCFGQLLLECSGWWVCCRNSMVDGLTLCCFRPHMPEFNCWWINSFLFFFRPVKTRFNLWFLDVVDLRPLISFGRLQTTILSHLTTKTTNPASARPVSQERSWWLSPR